MCESSISIDGKIVVSHLEKLCPIMEDCRRAETRNECRGNYLACSLYQERKEAYEN